MARNKTRNAIAVETLERRQVLSAAPTADLQYALELVNLARTKPAAVAERLTANLSETTRDTLDFFHVDVNREKSAIAAAESRQPLAWNDALASAAQQHSQDMANNGFQSHTGSDGSSVDDRIKAAGYGTPLRAAENAYAYSESVDQAMQAFTLDWGVADQGHRRNILEPGNRDDSFQEIGIGLARSQRPGMGLVVTQKFGLRANAPAQLLGVAYTDKDRDRFYTPGEGQGGVTIEVTNQDGQTNRTETAEPGGYQIALNPGRYRVRALVNNREVQARDIQIGRQNVKLDFILSDTPAPSTPAPAPTPTPVNRPTTIVTRPQITPKPAPAVTIGRMTTSPVVVPTRSTATTPVRATPPPAPVTVSIPTRVSTVLSNSTVTNATTAQAATVLLPGTQVTTFDRDPGFNWNTWKPASNIR